MTVTPHEALDRINAVFGVHAGHRALHAKGRFYTGTFTATPEAATLGRAGHLRGEPVPVLVRWSNGGGNPRVKDGAPDVRGMGVSFRLPDGTATDLLGQTAPRFPLRNIEEFLQLVESSKPWQIPLFVARHPHTIGAIAANLRAKSVVPPFSYAEVAYFPIHAYRWLAPDGGSNWVRYVLAPDGTGTRPAGKFEGRDRLSEEIVARLAEGPVRYTLQVSVAGPDDDPHDPTSVWKQARTFDAGTIEVTAPADDPEADGGLVVFDPTRVVDGIELSDDPILRYRAAAYSESVARRLGG